MSNVYLSSPYSSFFDLCQDAWRLASTCVFLGTYCGASCLVRIVPRLPACMFYPTPLATYSYSFGFFHYHHQRCGCCLLRTSVMLRIAGGRAQFDRLSCCNRRRLIPTPIPLALSISINDLGSYVLLYCSASLAPAPAHSLIFRKRRPLLPTPIPFALSISINDLGSYVLF